MRAALKKWVFWFGLFSAAICIHDYLGYDNKHFLVFMTSPINLFSIGWLTDMNNDAYAQKYVQPLTYLFHLVFWLGFGGLIDLLVFLIKKYRFNTRKEESDVRS